MHWLFNPGEEVSLILCDLLWLRVLLVQEFGLGSSVRLREDGSLEDPEAVFITNLLKFRWNLQIHHRPLSSRMLTKDLILAMQSYWATLLGIILGSA